MALENSVEQDIANIDPAVVQTAYEEEKARLIESPVTPFTDDMMGGFKDRLEDRAIQTSPAMKYFNDYKAQQVVEEVDEQEELIPSLIGKTVREPEVDAFTQIYALDAQDPVVQKPIQPKADKPLLQEGWDMLSPEAQKVAWPFAAPFVKGSVEENPILRGITEGVLNDAPQGIVDMSRDVVNALGGEFKEEDWLKIPQILESNPDSTTEGVVRGLSQFMSVFGAAGGIGKGATLFKQMMAGGLADATFDPTGGNVATLLRELDVDNELTQFLDSKVGEDADALERLEGRALQVLEGAGIGFAVGTLIGGLRWAKNNARELLQDSDTDLVPGVMKQFGIDIPKKEIVGFHNSPQKFDKIDPSKQQEGLMGKGHYIFLNKIAADDYPGAYKYTQEIPDDIRNRVINFGDGKDSLLVKSAFKKISEKTGIKFSDDFRPGSYFELINEVGHDKAHELLRAEGVIGNMTDIGTTSKPEAVMMYSPDDVQLLSRNGESLVQSQTNPKVGSQYHGTKEEYVDYGFGKNNTDPGWHFGSKVSAKSRLETIDIEEQINPYTGKRWRDLPENPVDSPKGHKIIENDLDIKNPLRVYEIEDPDMGTWDAKGIANNVLERDKLPTGFTQADKKAWKDGTLSAKVGSVDVQLKDVDSLDIEQHTEWIDNFLKDRGYDGLVYDNAFERGGDSYAVYNKNKITQLGAERYAAIATPAGAITTQDSESSELSDFIKGYEKYKGAGYYATKEEEKEGLVTVGYGSTRRVKHGKKVTKEQAEKWLKEDIKKANTTVNRLVKIELNNNQKNALISLVYNVGEGNFKKSKALKALNSGDIETFLKEAFDPKIGFVKAKKGGRILKGLVNRRTAEKELFMKGTK